MNPLNQHLHEQDPDIAAFIAQENERQEHHIELIASENYTSKAVMQAQGSQLTNKYAEGYPGKRYYGGCEAVDKVEQLAIDRAKALFEADYVNVQPHSGSQANTAVYMALLNPGDTILGLSLDHGGHLTHGAKPNFSGKLYNAIQYGLNTETGEIDYDQVEALAQEHKPKMIVAGFSAYSRVVDWQKFRDIADSVGAYLLVDMAHVAGLVAAGVYPRQLTRLTWLLQLPIKHYVVLVQALSWVKRTKIFKRKSISWFSLHIKAVHTCIRLQRKQLRLKNVCSLNSRSILKTLKRMPRQWLKSSLIAVYQSYRAALKTTCSSLI